MNIVEVLGTACLVMLEGVAFLTLTTIALELGKGLFKKRGSRNDSN